MPAPPLEECLETFWSPGLSPARLRALAAAPGAVTPDLLLRMFPPPPVRVRGKDLADVLAPAYQRLAADDPGRPGAISASPAWLAGPATGRGPDAEHGLGQAPPAERGQPLVLVDRAEHLPQRGDRQEQALHGEVVEFVVIGEEELAGLVRVNLVRVLAERVVVRSSGS